MTNPNQNPEQKPKAEKREGVAIPTAHPDTRRIDHGKKDAE
jgi:hypothetical protein